MTSEVEYAFLAGKDASRIAQLENMLRNDPENRKLRLQLANAKKRAEKSEALFRQALGSKDVDVLNYRVLRSDERYAMLGVAESLSSFQRSLTAIYDAFINGPKERAKFSSDIKERSKLYFDYSYPGSRGFILSIPDESTLFGSEFDASIQAYNDFLDISSSDDAIEASRSLGLAAISELYSWVRVNSAWGHSIDYNWMAGDVARGGRLVTVEKFSYLKEVFDGAEDREEKDFAIEGVLVGLDVNIRKFHFAEPDGDSIRGNLSDSYVSGQRIIPERYKAVIREVSKIVPATGKKTISYELLSLEDTG